MKKILAILCAALVLAAGLWFFLNQSNGLIPADQIATLEITHHNTPTVTATCDKVEQLRYLAGLMNKLELKPTEVSGIRPEFELTFRDPDGRTVTQITVYNDYLLANEEGAYRADLSGTGSDNIWGHLINLAQGRDIPVQDPDLALMFLGCFGVLLFSMFFGSICYLSQFLVCKSTGILLLHCLPILASSLVILGFFLNYNVFNVFTAMFILIAFAMKWQSPLILYMILTACGLLGHILGWRTGAKARREAAS